MTEFVSDAPIAAPPAQGKTERTPSNAQAKKRNNARNRKNHQIDGALSDGALVQSTSSPQKNHRQRQSVAIGATSAPKHPQQNMGNGNGQRISYSGNNALATPGKDTHYAGPTFQSSPAASALPKPKFSRSVPNVGARSSLSAKLAGEKTPEAAKFSPEADIVKPTVPAEEAHASPLDFLFNAQRADEAKERALSQSLSPDLATRPVTMPRNPFQHSGRSIFLSELDGDTDMPSPRTVPSNSHRPPFGQRTISSPGIPLRHHESEEHRQTSTKALKDLLFQTANDSNATTPRNQSRAHSEQQSPEGFFGPASPGPRSNSGPMTPQPANEQQQQQQQDHYSLHYGNRNLSPLFKAARSDTPPRSSSLRQEVVSDSSSNADSGIAVGDAHSPSTFARNYLNQTARTAGPAELPRFPYSNSHPASYGGSAIHNGIPNSAGSTSSNNPRTGGSKDIRLMEDDLRRMLKMNVLG